MAKYYFNTKRDTENFAGKVFIIPRVKHESPASLAMGEEAGVVGEAVRQVNGSYFVTREVKGRLYWAPSSIAEGQKVLGSLKKETKASKLKKLVGKKVKIKEFSVSGSSLEVEEMLHTIGKVGFISKVDCTDGYRHGASATIFVRFTDDDEEDDGWWYTPEKLKVVKDFEVGDLVIATEDNPYLYTSGEGRIMEVVEVIRKTSVGGCDREDIKLRVVADEKIPCIDQTVYSVKSKFFKLFTKKI